jgi:hypothetical protein
VRDVAGSALLLVLALGARPTAAQVIRGQVLDLATERAVGSAQVLLLDTTGVRKATVTSDSSGWFRLVAPDSGRYALRVERLGYSAVQLDTLTLGESEELLVVVHMDVRPIAVSPITVKARSSFHMTHLQEFYDRKARMEAAGLGRFMTRQQIEQYGVTYVTDLLRMFPSITINDNTRVVTMRRFGNQCQPLLYLDGVLANRRGAGNVDELITALDVEGVEVYHGLTQGPGEYHDIAGCGVILVWTRRGATDGRPFSWWRVLALGAGVLLTFVVVR